MNTTRRRKSIQRKTRRNNTYLNKLRANSIQFQNKMKSYNNAIRKSKQNYKNWSKEHDRLTAIEMRIHNENNSLEVTPENFAKLQQRQKENYKSSLNLTKLLVENTDRFGNPVYRMIRKNEAEDMAAQKMIKSLRGMLGTRTSGKGRVYTPEQFRALRPQKFNFPYYIVLMNDEKGEFIKSFPEMIADEIYEVLFQLFSMGYEQPEKVYEYDPSKGLPAGLQEYTPDS